RAAAPAAGDRQGDRGDSREREEAHRRTAAVHRAEDTMAAMTPRTILYTGKGGVGKTSVAAATARRCAGAGMRTLVISTDPAHSLSDSLGCRLGAEPSQIGDRLWGQEIAAQEELERNWSAVQEWLG